MNVTVTLQQWQTAVRLAEEIAAQEAAAPTRPSVLDDATSGDRVLGAVLGAAVGDALGHPTEFLRSYAAIHDRFGPQGVQGYVLYWERAGLRFAPYTDDTQLAEAVLRTLIWSRSTNADLETTMLQMAQRFVVWAFNPQGGHRAPGHATLGGCRRLSEGTPWREAGAPDAGGCGSVMRAYPFGIVFRDDIGKAISWAVEHSRLTHGASSALAACAAMAAATAVALNGSGPNETIRHAARAARQWDTETAELVEAAYLDGTEGKEPDEVFSRLLGWSAKEAIAAAAFALGRHAQDYAAGVLECANTPGDSDSIATLFGAIAGARLGLSSIPPAWVRDLERTAELQRLAEQAAS